MSQPIGRVAYLVSHYPAVSHTFILREILGLRALGLAIDTASINARTADWTPTPTEQAESADTFYIKAQGAGGALRAAGSLLLRRPWSPVSGLQAALSLAAANPARTLLYLFYLVEAIILANWMDERKLRHLHVHFAYQAATVALLATHLAPITLSMTVHGPDEFYDVPGSFLERKIDRARFAVCISFFARSQLMKIAGATGASRFDVVRLGVDPAHFGPRPFRAAPAVFEILCVGRLVATKGQHILLQAIEALLQSGRKVHLTLVGDGPDRAGLTSEVQKRALTEAVTFTGSVNQDNIRAYYQAADIFAMASFAEGIPVVLMEAMATEVPCVATWINGIPELIRDGVDGLLVAPSDVAGMAAALARLLDDAALRQALGAAGRRRVQQEYDLGTNIERLAETFRRRLPAAEAVAGAAVAAGESA